MVQFATRWESLRTACWLRHSTTTKLPGAPDGEYVVIQYKSAFANQPTAIETIVPMLDKDGKWHVSGYFIKPAEQ